MITQNDNQRVNFTANMGSAPVSVDPVSAAETILRRFGARAISLITQPRAVEDGSVIPSRLSANDCYVTLEEASRKMARVALRKYQSLPAQMTDSFSASLSLIFPDPVAYLARSIRSVISDAERMARREPDTISLDQPVHAGISSDGAELTLKDTFSSAVEDEQPEAALDSKTDRYEFRAALVAGLKSISPNYLAALQRDMARERERLAGHRVVPESDRERQTICRARAALSQIITRECGIDNPYVRLLAQQRKSRVRQKSTSTQNWTPERQDNLRRKLLSTSWAARSEAEFSGSSDANVEEAVVNEVGVHAAAGAAPPSPEMRKAMRVMDVYTLNDNPTAATEEAQGLYQQAATARNKGDIERAIKLYRAACEADPNFLAAMNETAVMLCQTGNLRDALKLYLSIIEKAGSSDSRYIAATNAADIYLTWFDAGRNKERNIERAIYFARLAMQRPTPMRACNLLLAYVKDRYYQDAQQVLETVVRENTEECPSERFLQTLFQIRDADLVSWWNWLDGEMSKETLQ